MPAIHRPITFALRLRAAADDGDPIKTLRSALKVLWRRHRLKCLEVVEEQPTDSTGDPRE